MTATRTASESPNVARVRRLSGASSSRFIEPDLEVTGALTLAQPIPDDLLSIAGLDLELTPARRATLAREELASVVRFGLLFEAVLMSGFAYQLALSHDVTNPRVTYALHEIGEETRHSRLFVRLLDELAPKQWNPFDTRVATAVRSHVLPLLFRRPATLDAFVLVGEEIPDLLQRLAAEHPDTDAYVRAISRYHRLEEARHLAFARITVGEHYERATWTDRFAVRWIVPLAIVFMFDMIVQPFVYRTVGLRPLRTWWQVRKLPKRVALRRQSARAVLDGLLGAGALRRGRVPFLWRRVAGVARDGACTAA
jgi:hypothetical protein